MLLLFDRDGKTKQIENLNPLMFNKAEGIAYFENGDMLITSEGQHKHPALLRFSYKK